MEKEKLNIMKNHPRGLFERPSGSSVWWVRYHDACGRERREKAGAKSVALELYRKRKTEALQGRKLPERLPRAPIYFSALAERAMVYSKAHKRSFAQDSVRMPLLLNWFGSRPASSITAGEIEQHLTATQTERGWSPATVNRYRSLLSLTFTLALKDKKVDANPVQGVKQLTENNQRERYLSGEEERRLRAAILERCSEHIADLDLALNTGMRKSEQLGLRWENINWERRTLTIARSKHGEARRVPLNSAALDALEALQGANLDTEWVCPRGVGERPCSPRRWFEGACRAAKLSNFGWHDLRHTFASRLVMSGVGLRTVQKLLGHKSMRTTERYAHLSPEHELAAVETLLQGYSLLPNQPAPEPAPACDGDTPTRRYSSRCHGKKLG